MGFQDMFADYLPNWEEDLETWQEKFSNIQEGLGLVMVVLLNGLMLWCEGRYFLAFFLVSVVMFVKFLRAHECYTIPQNDQKAMAVIRHASRVTPISIDRIMYYRITIWAPSFFMWIVMCFYSPPQVLIIFSLIHTPHPTYHTYTAIAFTYFLSFTLYIVARLNELRFNDTKIFYSLSIREQEKQYEQVACKDKVSAYSQTSHTSMRAQHHRPGAGSARFSHVNDFQR